MSENLVISSVFRSVGCSSSLNNGIDLVDYEQTALKTTEKHNQAGIRRDKLVGYVSVGPKCAMLQHTLHTLSCGQNHCPIR